MGTVIDLLIFNYFSNKNLNFEFFEELKKDVFILMDLVQQEINFYDKEEKLKDYFELLNSENMIASFKSKSILKDDFVLEKLKL